MKKKNADIKLSLRKKMIMRLNDDQELKIVGGVTNTEALSACRTNCAACPPTTTVTIITCAPATHQVSCAGGSCNC